MINSYKNFKTAMYLRAHDISPLKDDISPFIEQFTSLNNYMNVDKVYIETHRDMVVPAESILILVRNYLNGLGIKTSAGITVTIDERNNFQTYCYSDPFYRSKLKELVALSVRLFDELVFDDFYFTNCKCPLCIEEKGDRSWTEFRLEQMTTASTDIVMNTARAINPNARIVIKYPNWYEHFQGLGFNLKDQPAIYDGVYSGNETRDAMFGAQHLQPYESYSVFRYFENIKPGKNFGGWVDPFASQTLDRYAEQLWLTMLAKSPEITLFDYFSLQMPIKENQRGAWQDLGTCCDFDEITLPVRNDDGILEKDATMAVVAGAALKQIDGIIDLLGNPIGVASYLPCNSSGEAFLHNYLGMLGLPIELVPQFPIDAQTVFLAESAKFDTQIVDKMKKHMLNGKTVIITSGLLKALQGKGIEDIVEIECSDRKIISDKMTIGWDRNVYECTKPIMMPILQYFTNDSWEELSLITKTSGAPLIHSAKYGNSKIYIMTVLDDYNDLYALPREAISKIKSVFSQNMYVQIEADANVSLFAYDNDTFVVYSFLDEMSTIKIVLDESYSKAVNLLTEEEISFSQKEQVSFFGSKKLPFIESEDIQIKPHSYMVFRAEK